MTRIVVLAIASALFAGAAVAVATSTPSAQDNLEHGQTVYTSHCVECHGTTGRGDGPASAHLTPAPRDFTSGKYKIRSTETGSLPTDDDLLRSVRQGIFGSAMPAWEGLLSDNDTRDVVQFVKTLSPRFAAETPKAIVPGPQIANSPDSASRGDDAYEKLQCGKCHGIDGRGTGAVATEFEDDWQHPLRAADLTEPWTFHGGATARDIYLRFRTGMSGTPMPSFADAASDAEMWDLANYIVSLARKPVWAMNATDAKVFYTQLQAREKANPVNRGAYLVETMGCVVCHSPVDATERVLPGMRLAGGMLIRINPFGDYPTGNLTSDKETGLGNWTDDQIKQAITRGVLRDGSRLLPYPMDWASYSTMRPDDVSAIVAYLRTVPAVSNKVPKPSQPFLPLYLWGKFKMLLLGDDPPMVILAGNVGTNLGAKEGGR